MEMCTATSISRKQQKHRLLRLFQRQGHPKLTNPIVYAVRFLGIKKKENTMAVIPTESQLIGKGVIFSYARICCTHTHTRRQVILLVALLAQLYIWAKHCGSVFLSGDAVGIWSWAILCCTEMSHTLQAVYYPRPLLTNCQYYAQ